MKFLKNADIKINTTKIENVNGTKLILCFNHIDLFLCINCLIINLTLLYIHL